VGGVQQWKAINKRIISMSKKATIQAHTCYQCCHAYLMRSAPHNPVVAECAITHQREVASTMIRCRHFKQRVGEAEINQMIKENDMEYLDFLNTKQVKIQRTGFNVTEDELNPVLFDFQKYCVRNALAVGKYALFEDCGLGKTIQQLEWAKQVCNHTNKPVLILAPLGVIYQTIQEGVKYGYDVKEIALTVFDQDLAKGIYITNYDNMDSIDAYLFSGVVLDESSILKNFNGKTKQQLIDDFNETPYKLCCTATPSPNDVMELCNHAEFLNIMTRNEMLAMYFVHDGGNTSSWRLKGHAETSFWDFVSTWAVMLTSPSDIGFDGSRYVLPKLNIQEVFIETKKRNNGMLFNDIAVSATTFHKELRATEKERMAKVAKMVNESKEQFIIWIGHDDEGKILRSLIPDAIEVKGSDSKQYKKENLLGFADGKFRVLITKLKIAQFGLNYQNCHNQIFASLDFSFEATYQGIRRSYRFGQMEDVNIYLVVTDTMQNVRSSIIEKQASFLNMQKKMSEAMNRNINNLIKLQNMEVEKSYKSEFCDIRLGDCVQLIKDIPDESVGFSIFSPPFAELYTYSDKLEDMGNSKDYKEFFTAFNFLVKELYRVLWSGRNIAVHCMDLPIQKGKEGFIGLRDFSGMILKAFQDAGFIYHSRVTIWKNPVTEMQRTKALGLLHKQVKKDSSMSRVGIPDYLLVFRKEGEHGHPIHCDIDVDTWQKYASPVWMDIDYSNTLNATAGRESNDEKHVCPLQLDTIKRAITLWSNEGDTVLTPFLGIGSEVYQSILMNRNGLGFELKDSYFNEAIKNCKKAEFELNQKSLFDAV
jgi:DNA modification methylase